MFYLIIVSILLTIACGILYAFYDSDSRGTASPNGLFFVIAVTLFIFSYIGSEDYWEQKALNRKQANIIKDYQEAERKLLNACELNLPRTQKCEIIAVPKE